MIMHIDDQSNFLIPSEYKGTIQDTVGGFDIALIRIDQDQNSRIDAFIAFNDEYR